MAKAARNTNAKAPKPADLESQIRTRAYEIYLARGDQPGSPEEDWLRAEAEIRGNSLTATA